MAKLLLVQNLWMEQLGIMSVAATAKARGHTVKAAIGSDEAILKTARAFQPDVVGFSVLTGFQRRWSRLGKTIKETVKPSPLIIFGGPHPTFFPQAIMDDGVDLLCRGEGEGAISEIMDAVESGLRNFQDVRNIVFKNEDGFIAAPLRPLEDLNRLPFPDREIYAEYPFILKDPSTHFISGRGCPYSCLFCFNHKMRELCDGLGPAVRRRSVENMLEEIGQVSAKRKMKVVYFQDDTFILDRKWLFAFLEQYSRRFRIPFYCTVRADLLTPEIAKALKDAGCYRVSFGVESGVEQIRRALLNKDISDDRIREAARILRDSGIPFQTTNMMGLPGEKLEDAIKTLKLNIEIGADVAWTSIYQPYPGTEMAERAMKDGYLDRIPDDERIADAHTSSVLKQPEIDEIVRLQKFAYLSVKFPVLLPIILKLIKYDFSNVYYYVHRVSYLLFYFMRLTDMSLSRTLKEAYIAWRYYR